MYDKIYKMIFSLFKSNFKDESDEDQLNEFLKFPFSKEVKELVKNKKPLDKIKNTKGEFGKDPNNPIPVNGPSGTIKYLSRLRSTSNFPFTYHRLGTIHIGNTASPVDCYELISLDGAQWEVLFFDIYWPKRSRLAPSNCYFSEFHPEYSTNTIFSYGVNSFDNNFPYGIPEILENNRGVIGKRIAEDLKNKLFDKTLNPPKDHKLMIYVIENRILNEGIDPTPRSMRYDLD